MNSIEQFGLIDLTKEEQLMVFGGDKALKLLGQALGFIAAAIVDLAEAFYEGCVLSEGQIAMHGR